MKKEILVHDDEQRLVSRYVQRLQSVKCLRANFDVKRLDVPEFRKEMETLVKRRRAFRNGKTKYEGESVLDKAAIFVVDFDLLKSDPEGVWNSENVAYLVRCFSTCGLIIGLNLPRCHEFDLSLRGNMSSYADVNLVNKQLDNERLWGGSVADSFRPWYWPTIVDYLESFEQRLKDVEENLDAPILKVLELESIVEMLPKTASEFIGGKSPLEVTFKAFTKNPASALRAKDKNSNPEIVCRIATARISKWLERRILPGQNIVVDAPHLASRYPSLLVKGHDNLNSWNQCANFDSYKQLNIDYGRIERFRYSKSYWFSRPVWFWRSLAEFARIKEVSSPWDKEPTAFRFCEDASRFYGKRVCKEFNADVDSPYNRRFVRRFINVDYQPRVRLFV